MSQRLILLYAGSTLCSELSPGIAGIDAQEDGLYSAIAEMLVDWMALPEDFHLKIDAIGEFGAIGGEFQPVTSTGENIIYPAPDSPIAVRSPFDGQKLSRVPANPVKIDPAGLHVGYLPNLALPGLGPACCVLRSYKFRVGDEVDYLLCTRKISKEGKPRH